MRLLVCGISAAIRGHSREAAAFINNVGDERARLAIDRERGLRARYGFLTNPPHTYGATVRKSFQASNGRRVGRLARHSGLLAFQMGWRLP
ncbi:hypothetical protein [Phenylobacterium sp.]|uniref:hypothetical protein n=1 Tax=Phenylobacterium sp. TaxID=1871053 RepID=UPI0037C53A77